MPGSLSHLARRFFDVLFSRPLAPDEAATVRGLLSPAEAVIFFSQPGPDQRHGYHAATIVLESGQKDRAVTRAALLHDIGKRHTRLGVVGRSLASILIRLRLPMTRRAALYRDHGEIGADELSGLGCEPIVVDFARAHHGPRPESVPETIWDLLQLADQPPKPGAGPGPE
ncbi:MAG: HDIG domain-containing metalloprotein [Acidimicrobiia bacterium]